MNDNVKDVLHDSIEEGFEGLKTIEIGTEEYKTTIDGLTKLVDKTIEIDKNEKEQAQKEAELAQEKKDNRIKHGISIAGILVPTAVTIWGTLKSLNFEKTGSVTTILGRGFISKLLPKK